jgi:hypothetical protein
MIAADLGDVARIHGRQRQPTGRTSMAWSLSQMDEARSSASSSLSQSPAGPRVRSLMTPARRVTARLVASSTSFTSTNGI